jgi:hypothetical protein
MFWYSFTVCRRIGYIEEGGQPYLPLTSFCAPAPTPAGAYLLFCTDRVKLRDRLPRACMQTQSLGRRFRIW